MSVSTEVDNVGNVHNNKTIKYQATSSYFYDAWIQLQKIRSSHSRSHLIIHKILEKFFHLNEVSQFSLIFLQVSMSAKRPISSSHVVFLLRNKMASFSFLTSFVKKPVQKSTHLNIYCHFRMVQLYVTNTKVCCFLPWTSNCQYTRGYRLFCAGRRLIHKVMLWSTELTLLLPQVGSQAQKRVGDIPEMIRDCGYFAFCAIKTSVAGKDTTLKKSSHLLLWKCSFFF